MSWRWMAAGGFVFLAAPFLAGIPEGTTFTASADVGPEPAAPGTLQASLAMGIRFLGVLGLGTMVAALHRFLPPDRATPLVLAGGVWLTLTVLSTVLEAGAGATEGAALGVPLAVRLAATAAATAAMAFATAYAVRPLSPRDAREHTGFGIVLLAATPFAGLDGRATLAVMVVVGFGSLLWILSATLLARRLSLPAVRPHVAAPSAPTP
jgi:hypothetical protein